MRLFAILLIQNSFCSDLTLLKVSGWGTYTMIEEGNKRNGKIKIFTALRDSITRIFAPFFSSISSFWSY